MRNCLTYAVGKYIKAGGYLVVRKSRFAQEIGASRWNPAHLVPHFLHMSGDFVLTQYVPTREDRENMRRRGAFRQWLALWHFDGEIREGDHAPSDN